jgi:argininosuccinate synthase
MAGRKSPRSLYSEEFVTFEKDRVFDQKEATGFIKLNALRMKIQALMERSKG